MKQTMLSEHEKDTLGEVGNIAMGAAATALSALLGKEVRITAPRVVLSTIEDISKTCQDSCLLCAIDYVDGLSGRNLLVVKKRDAAVIVDLMMGGDGTNPGPIDELALSAIGEAMNQMIGTAATSMSTMFNIPIQISPPRVSLCDLLEEGLAGEQFAGKVVQISFQMTIKGLVESEMIQIMNIDFAKKMVATLTGGDESAENESRSEKTAGARERREGITELRPASFGELEPEKPQSTDKGNLDLILDVPLEVTVELGRTTRKIREVLALGVGSILELDKQAGEPVEILVNGKPVARGEVVVIEENFGVRVTEILEVKQRVASL